jgi:hypothetical protein
MAAIALVPPSNAAEPTITLQTTGVQAPGLPAGVTFSGLGQPTLNSVGQIVFRGVLTGMGVTANDNTGLWGGTPGALSLVAREGGAVPGHPGITFNEFVYYNAGGLPPNLTPDGSLIFAQSTRSGTNFGGAGAFFRPGAAAPLETLARAGTPRPDGSGNWGNSEFGLNLSPSGRFILRDSGTLYTGTSAGALSLVTRPGNTFGGKTIESVINSSITRNNTVLLLANADPAVIDERYVAFAYRPTSPTNVARLLSPGDPAPGVTPPKTFLRSGNVHANSAGDFVIGGTLTGSTSIGVWKGNFAAPGTLTKVLAQGDPAPGAPGTTFATSTRQYISGSGLMFINAELQGSSISNSNRSGVWIGRSAGDLKLLARYGNPVGLPGFAASERWGSLTLAANDNQQAVIGGRLLGQTQALVGYDPSLGLVPLVKTGDAITVSPGETKTIASLSVAGDDFIYSAASTNEGRGAPVNDAGEVVYRAVFTDQSQAILKTRIPVAGDATFDGIVNAVDFGILYDNFGKTFATPSRATGDFDLDGRVTFLDFQMLERNFGRAPPGASVATPADYARLAEFAATVPEPGTLTFLALAAAGACARRRIRSSLNPQIAGFRAT